MTDTPEIPPALTQVWIATQGDPNEGIDIHAVFASRAIALEWLAHQRRETLSFAAPDRVLDSEGETFAKWTFGAYECMVALWAVEAYWPSP